MKYSETRLFSRQLESALEAAGVTGASFAYWDGTALHTAVAGLRNSVTGDPVTVDTVMHIGSITKVLNTVLIMQLVDEGKVNLEHPITQYLPELRLRDSEALKRITCKMLINHTSGIDGDMLPNHGTDQERIVDAIARCAELGQLHAPGEAASYSNVATVIAGYLTQRLLGTSWYSLVKTRIYQPLGMMHALSEFTDLPLYRQSVGDLTDPETGRLVQTTRPFLAPSFAPCGTTLMMSASDLVTFTRALLNGGVGPNGVRILSAVSAARMMQPTVAMLQPIGCKWGLGWMILPSNVLYHAGGGPGVCSVVYAHPSSGQAVALLTNCDRWEALKPAIIAPILETWTGMGQRTPMRRSEPIDAERYAGIYENNTYRIEVRPSSADLALRMVVKNRIYDNVVEQGYSPITVHPLGDETFEGLGMMPGSSKEEFRFAHPDATGRMQTLGWMMRLLVRTG
jgi:CubicO group peptidase (beta-lactamase class C family)